MAVIDHITTNNSATYEVQDTVARTKANNLESANYTDIGVGSQMAILSYLKLMME